MSSSIKRGRDKKFADKNKSKEMRFPGAGSLIMMTGAAICVVYLMTALSGSPSAELKLDDVSRAASAKLAENEAVAVFLGLDTVPHEDSVYVMADLESVKSADVYIDSEKLGEGWSLWGYLSDTVRGIFSPLLP